jgi:hypothetical protein
MSCFTPKAHCITTHCDSLVEWSLYTSMFKLLMSGICQSSFSLLLYSTYSGYLSLSLVVKTSGPRNLSNQPCLCRRNET